MIFVILAWDSMNFILFVILVSNHYCFINLLRESETHVTINVDEEHRSSLIIVQMHFEFWESMWCESELSKLTNKPSRVLETQSENHHQLSVPGDSVVNFASLLSNLTSR